MIQYLYLGRVDYGAGLRLQEEIAALVAEGRAQNVLLLLEHPPVLTLGRNADRANILASEELLASRGVTVHEINRGGDVTYHGPGQLVGYPIFDLRTLRAPSGGRMGPVDFVRGMEEALIRLCGGFGVRAGRIHGLTGVWCGGAADQGSGSGAASVRSARSPPSAFMWRAGSLRTASPSTSPPTCATFMLIVPCGIADHAVTSLEKEIPDATLPPTLEALAHQTARYFGQVFDEQVLAIENLAALRAQAAADPDSEPQYPAEDTPLQTPPGVERLLGCSNRPSRA